MHPHEAYSLHKPLAYSDVYMDDFLGLAQSSTATQTQQAILNSIDAIFRALYPTRLLKERPSYHSLNWPLVMGLGARGK
jgi:hypothetical protein